MFEFSGSDVDGEVVGYRYKIDNGDWLHTTNNRVDISNLQKGDHTFYVSAKDNDGAWDESPAEKSFSITLEKIAFSSNRDGNWEIYIMSIEGTITRLTNNNAEDGLPTFSPNGSEVAFTSYEKDKRFNIFVIDINSGFLLNLAHSAHYPAWSPR